MRSFPDFSSSAGRFHFTVRDDLPQVQLMDQKLDDARAALHENVTSSINQLKLTLNTLDSRITVAEKDLGRLPGTERRLIGIQRKFDLNNSVYTYPPRAPRRGRYSPGFYHY
ncbi:MAG: hypothetical protein U5L72_17170 [Bacteroidales bacterium]|nr:hypothetical protein [Bacteroidales bacterium]